jgi:hypothetical protein
MQNWSLIARSLGTGRNGKSCRLRWFNQLDPKLRRDPFTPQEEEIIIAKHTELGNRWAAIARFLPGRTDNSIKNYWNGHLRKRIGHRTSELAAAKRLRALAGLALGDEDAPDSNGGAITGAITMSGVDDEGRDDDGDEGDVAMQRDQDEYYVRPSKSARTGTLASPRRRATSTGAAAHGTDPSVSAPATSPRRHVTRAATGTLRVRHFDELVDDHSQSEEEEVRLPRRNNGMVSMRRMHHASISRGHKAQRSLPTSLREGAVSAPTAGDSRDSSHNTKSTGEHCSDHHATCIDQALGSLPGTLKALDRSLSSVASDAAGLGGLNAPLLSSFAAVMSTLFPSPDQLQSLNEEQRLFLKHFHAAFAKIMQPESADVGPLIGAKPEGSVEVENAETACNGEEERETVGNENRQASAECPAEAKARGMVRHANSAAETASRDAGLDGKASQAMFLGQMLLNMTNVFPAMSSAVVALSQLKEIAPPPKGVAASDRVTPGPRSGANDNGGSSADAGDAAPTSELIKAPKFSKPVINPTLFAAAPFMQATFGDMLAARLSGSAGYGHALPDASTVSEGLNDVAVAATPLKVGTEDGEGFRGPQLATPVSQQAARPGSACRDRQEDDDGDGLAALAELAANMGCE